MLFGQYEISCVFTSPASLPPYKGSTFRGLFGHALKKVVCVLKTGVCADCLLRSKCLYAQVFEVIAESNDEGKRRLSARPHPYVIEPSADTKTAYQAGDRLDFSLLLFGKFNDSLPYFIFAIEQMGQMSLGRKIEGRRPHYILKEVTSGDSLIYSGETKKMLNDCQLRDICLAAPSGTPVTRVEINLLTPLRLKYLNELESELPFHVLIRAALRRISSLFKAFGAGEPELDYRGLVRRAQEISAAESHLHWLDWRRWSNRQKREMQMGGLIGKVIYEGDLTEFIPLLRLCQMVHLGKQTAFGLGKIKIFSQ